jgi:hypothetical protein
MPWEDIQREHDDNMPTEKQIKYASILQEALLGEVFLDFKKLTKHELSGIIDRLKEECIESNIGYHNYERSEQDRSYTTRSLGFEPVRGSIPVSPPAPPITINHDSDREGYYVRFGENHWRFVSDERASERGVSCLYEMANILLRNYGAEYNLTVQQSDRLYIDARSTINEFLNPSPVLNGLRANTIAINELIRRGDENAESSPDNPERR